MVVSYKLLSSICSEIKKSSFSELFNAFNSVGIEVETIRHHPKNGNLEIVKIINIENHPNADKLHLVTIQKINNEQLTIVCGANNLLLNHYAIYAPVGTTLFSGIKIEPRDIRGVVSNGMLCAYSELSDINPELLAEEDKKGVILFHEKQLISRDVNQLVNLNDTIFELSIPSNRNDLNSYYGILQEIAPILKIDFKLDYELEDFQLNTNGLNINVDENLCSSFGLIAVNNIPKFVTTWKQKEILVAHGLKVHNNWLDFFNIFTLIYNNPVHIYDLDKLCPNHEPINFNIQKIKQPSKVFALDSQTYEVNDGIAIYQDDRLINVAGIIGLDDYKYETSSNNIIIEVANFNHIQIKKTSNQMKLQTKASQLFAKPIANWITKHAFNQVYEYFNLMMPHNVSAIAQFKPIEIKSIPFDFEKFNHFIGTNLPVPEIKKILNSMNFIINGNQVSYHPSRFDLINQYDLFEELIKIIDINKLEPVPIFSDVLNFFKTDFFDEINIAKEFLVNNGFFEVKTYNLVHKSKLDSFNFFNSQSSISIMNPISNIHEYYRNNLINELLDVIKYNLGRKRDINNIFEFQPLYFNNKLSHTLSMLFINKPDNKLNSFNKNWDLIAIKSFTKALFKKYGNNLKFTISPTNIEQVYDKQQLEVYLNDQLIGYIAMIKKSVLKQYDIEFDCYCLFVKVDHLMLPITNYQVKPVSNFPIVNRDINISLNADQNANINEIIAQILLIEGIDDCFVIDYFQKDNKLIYTCNLRIVSYTKTLSNNDIQDIVNQVNECIKKHAN